MDIKAALCRLLLTEWGKAGQRVYQKRLPQRDGTITSKLPAVVVRLVSDNSIGNQCCDQSRRSARIQIAVFADSECCDKLEPLKESLIYFLNGHRGQIGGLNIELVRYLSNHDRDLPELNLERVISDYKVIYQRRA